MRVLVACEESQTVCKAFRKRGHEAYSCDIQPCSGGHPEWHIQDDVRVVIKSGYYGRFDLIIAHPPCTYLCLSGMRWNVNNPERQQKTEEAIEFFKFFIDCYIHRLCDYLAIENPVGVISNRLLKPTQYIRPCEFGHPTGKKTGLWLFGLPTLKPTNMVNIEYHKSKSGRMWDKWFFETSKIADREERSRVRSKTFEGIAEAMAEQWDKENLWERL